MRRRFQNVCCDFKNCAEDLEDSATIYFPSIYLSVPQFLPAGEPVPEPKSCARGLVTKILPCDSDHLPPRSATPECIKSDDDQTELQIQEMSDNEAQINPLVSPVLEDEHETEAQNSTITRVSPEIPDDSLNDPDERFEEVHHCLSKAPKDALLAERKDLVEDVRCILEMMSRRTDFLEQRSARFYVH